MLAALGLGAHAQVTQPGAAGDYCRALMLDNVANYQAAVDQLVDSYGMSDSDMLRARLLEARAMYSSGDYAGASTIYHAILAAAPASAEVLVAKAGLADCLYARGQYAEALEAYRAVGAERLAPADAARLNYNCGICAYETGNADEAAKYFAEAASESVTRSAANYYLGVLAFEKGDYAKARNYFGLTNRSVEPGSRAPSTLPV